VSCRVLFAKFRLVATRFTKGINPNCTNPRGTRNGFHACPRFIPTLRWRWGFSPVPLRCVFWSAMTRISHHCQVIIAQVNLDHSVFCLLSKVRSVYEFLLEDGTKAILDVMKDTLARITQVVSSCAQFIENYSETKMLCMPLQILP